MPTRRYVVSLAAAALTEAVGLAPGLGQNKGQDRRRAVATFSILGDLVTNVGGERVELATLVGPDGDVHVYEPTPRDVTRIAAADLVFVNGLGLEGWIDRLITASGSRGAVVVVSRSITPRDHQSSVRGIAVDPHAWQSVANAKIYVANIRDGLVAADRNGEKTYQTDAADYLAKLDAVDGEIKAAIAAIPPARRKVITTHSAFGYFADEYGIDFIAAEGLSTDAEPSARDVAKLIEQIRRENITALFLENVSDQRLLQRIAAETGVRVGGKLYSDALSPPDGPAGTYIDMMRSNLRELTRVLTC